MRFTATMAACAALLSGAGCKNDVAERPLAIDQNSLNFAATASSSNILVYGSGDWKASLPEDVEWASLENASGSGLGQFKIVLQENLAIGRRTEITIEGKPEDKIITINQAGALSDVLLSLDVASADFVRTAAESEIGFSTNMTGGLFELLNVRVEYTDPVNPPSEWISNISLTEDKLSFLTASNTGDATRKAAISIEVHDPTIPYTYQARLNVVQTADDPTMAFISPTLEIEPFATGYSAPFATNLGLSAAEVVSDVDYEDGVEPWISNIVVGAEAVTFDATENTTEATREATITLSYTDPAAPSAALLTATVDVTQKRPAFDRSFEYLRERIPGASGTQTFTDDFFEGVVIASGKENVNVELNPNTAYNTIDFTENEKTAYIQNLDGTYGFRIKTPTAADNTLVRGTRVKIALNGLTLVKEAYPATRYTFTGFAQTNIVESAEGTIVEKKKSLSELADADIYTFTTIEDVEFAVKTASLSNVHEYYCEKTDLSTEGRANIAYSDCYPIVLRDAGGEQTKMLINLRTPWRKDTRNNGNALTDLSQTVYSLPPRGAGDVSGVIVSTDYKRYYADSGKYQIRPLEREDIAIAEDAAEGFSEVHVAWDFAWSSPSVKKATDMPAGSKKVIPYPGDGPQDGTAYLYTSFTQNRLNNPSGPNATTDPWALNVGYSHPGYTPGSLTNGTLRIGSRNGNAGLTTKWWNYTDNKPEWMSLNFPTTGVAGSNMTLVFDIVGGAQSANSNMMPVNWEVVYSVDGAATFQKVPGSDFQVRMLMEANTNSLFMPIGLVEYAFSLPDECFDKPGVELRIQPKEPSYLDYTDGIVKPLTGALEVNNMIIRFGYIGIKYNK